MGSPPPPPPPTHTHTHTHTHTQLVILTAEEGEDGEEAAAEESDERAQAHWAYVSPLLLNNFVLANITNLKGNIVSYRTTVAMTQLP